MTVHHNMYTFLEWDSTLFGYKVARIQNPLPDSNISEDISIMKDNGIKLVYVISDPSEQKINDTIVAHGGVLVDTKVLYTKRLDTHSLSNYGHAQISSYTDSHTDPNLLSLAFQSGVYSRFFNDAQFIHNEYQKLYSQWIEQAIHRNTAFDILVYRDEKNTIVGFITLEKEGNTGKVGLFGVDSTMRRKQIGTDLMRSAYRSFIAQNVTAVHIATQKRNIPACNFYEKQGFDILSQQNVYHIWLYH